MNRNNLLLWSKIGKGSSRAAKSFRLGTPEPASAREDSAFEGFSAAVAPDHGPPPPAYRSDFETKIVGQCAPSPSSTA